MIRRLGLADMQSALRRSPLVRAEAAFQATLMGGSIGGIVLALLMIIVASLPLCCGVMKQFGKAGWVM